VRAVEIVRHGAARAQYAALLGILTLARDDAGARRLRELAAKGTAARPDTAAAAAAAAAAARPWSAMLDGGVAANVLRVGGLRHVLSDTAAPRATAPRAATAPKPAPRLRGAEATGGWTAWVPARLRAAAGGKAAAGEGKGRAAPVQPRGGAGAALAELAAAVRARDWRAAQRGLAEHSAAHMQDARARLRAVTAAADGRSRALATVGVTGAMAAAAVVAALRVRVISCDAPRPEAFSGEGPFFLDPSLARREQELNMLIASAIEDCGLRCVPLPLVPTGRVSSLPPY